MPDPTTTAALPVVLNPEAIGNPDQTAPVVRMPRVVHECPPEGSGRTPCCDRTPFELPLWHRMTLDPELVTCDR